MSDSHEYAVMVNIIICTAQYFLLELFSTPPPPSILALVDNLKKIVIPPCELGMAYFAAIQNAGWNTI